MHPGVGRDPAQPNNSWTPAFAGVQPKSTPSNEMDDLEIVAILDADLRQGRARNHLEVALDRDPQRVEAELAYHLGDAHPAGDSAMLAVDAHREASIQTH